jgi:hypothetical protein
MRPRAGWWTGLGCVALALLHAPRLLAAPTRGYDGPGAVDVGAAPEPIEPRFPEDPGAPKEPGAAGGSDDPGEPGPPATDAAGSGTPTTKPADLEQAAEGEAEPPTFLPRHRIIYRNLLAARANPVGLVDEITVGYRYQLVQRDTELFRDSFLLAGAHAFVTPAFVRVGPVVEVQPAAVLNLSATYDFVGYFGAFDNVSSFRTPTARAGPDDLLGKGIPSRGYATWGHLVTLSALLQAKVRHVALRNQLKFFWSKLKLREGETVYFDFANDILTPNEGWVLTNDTDLLWVFDVPVVFGVRHTLTHAFYTQDDFLPGEPVSQPNGPTSRLGPAVVWTIFDRPGARFNRPSIIVLAQWWVRHRWRTGEQVHGALPYAVIGFQFEGDLWPARGGGQRRSRR